IGHAVVDASADAPGCDCGGRGHLGAIASGRGIEREARRRAAADPTAFAASGCASRYGATATTLTNEGHLVPAVLEGDAWAGAVVRSAVRPLARLLLPIILAIGLEKVIVIGGFALAAGQVYVRMVEDSLRELNDYDIIDSALSGIVQLGAAADQACL